MNYTPLMVYNEVTILASHTNYYIINLISASLNIISDQSWKYNMFNITIEHL